MIITKTPFRMSFFGGGTDFQEFYEVHGGAVISTTFDKYCHVTLRHLPRFFEYKNLLTYSKNEQTTRVEDIEHPAIREAMKFLNMQELRLIYDADLPARSGLGTSSSFAVGMLNACYALKGIYANKQQLAKEAIYLERVLCKEVGGIQDQIAASYGGLNRIDFSKTGYTVTPIIISKERKQQLNDRLLLFFTGFSRYSSTIQHATKQAIQSKEQQLLTMLAMVDQVEAILTDKDSDLDEFGRMLDVTWKLKRGLNNNISCTFIDTCYTNAMSAGALGGKLLGAGGGGFLLFYVQPEKQHAVKQALQALLHVPFNFENEGTRVIYYEPEDYEHEDAT